MTRRVLVHARILAAFAALAAATAQAAGDAKPAPPAAAAGKVSFAHHVRPILSANCFACHGPDDAARQADLRLDVRESAVDYGAIVPGDAAASLLTERITADDPEVIMPPPDSGFRLTPEQIELLQRWIQEGAEYTQHWSLVPIVRPAPPNVYVADWPSSEIDYFTLRRMEEAGLAPAAEADPYTLVRRASLDLIGVPPSPELADRFAAAPSDEAYEQLVDDLLASPQFGEHWARVWLDLGRYADTKGYEKDLPRHMWPFRDWVIRALNADIPYDQFTVEQLAGDLLPEPTRDQLIATAFHRSTMSNDEAGTDDEEFRVLAVKDRVDTSMQVWMGLTAGCAKCHSHKFDPISHEEYYQLFAIFNQTADTDAHDDSPVLRFETPEQAQQLAELKEKIEALKKHAAEQKNSASEDKPESDSDGSRRTNDSDGNSPASTQLTELEQQLQKAESKVTKLPIMRELDDEKRRPTRVHVRGNFLEQGAEVSPSVPAAFAPSQASTFDRLALAQWLVSEENPLTARVAANRVWARFFGIGIVETEGDFGSQGTPPSHPLLLDWLAMEFRDTHQWSLKKLCKTIVMSSTYRQSSIADAAKLRADPQNRLLARGPRFRLPAEVVRDQALATSGLLSRKMYGPPVMPPQPPGVWKSIYNSAKWETSSGEDRCRRALYTYWKRTSPYPAMIIFDAESREVCSVRRIHTNTPLQALVLMNDPVYLEAAAALAKRALDETGTAAEQRIERAFRLLLIRPPTAQEVDRLDQLRIAAEQKFAAEVNELAGFLAACNASEIGHEPLAPAEFASYVIVASVILNLDESVTRN
jgi:hypothetical protein